MDLKGMLRWIEARFVMLGKPRITDWSFEVFLVMHSYFFPRGLFCAFLIFVLACLSQVWLLYRCVVFMLLSRRRR